MRLTALTLAFCLAAQSLWADVDRLIDAMGLPQVIAAFTAEGRAAGDDIDDAFLGGQGGAIWADAVERLYDPARMEADLRAVMGKELDPDIAEQALLFFESEVGARIVALEVEARRAFMDEAVEEAAKAAPAAGGDAVTDYLEARNLIDLNTDVAVAAQTAFLEGLALASGQAEDPVDLEQLRARIQVTTESWLRGYNALVQSALNADDIAIYTSFWTTEVGAKVDEAMFLAFGQSYTTLSYALGQAAGRLLPQNEL